MIKRIREGVRGYFEDWNAWEKWWLLVALLLVAGLSVYWKDTWIGIIASVTGILCVVLTAKGRISNYYFGIVNVLTYAYVAYGQKYYGEVMLNLIYYLPMSFYGIWFWRKNRKAKRSDEVYVKRMSWRARLAWLFICAAGSVFYGMWLKHLGANLPFINAITVMLSIAGMLLTARIFMEQWALWIVVDVLTVAMWVIAFVKSGNDISVLVMWVAWLVNATYGLVNWVRLYGEQKIKSRG